VVDDPVQQALGAQDPVDEHVVPHGKETAADRAGDDLLPGVVVEMDTIIMFVWRKGCIACMKLKREREREREKVRVD